MGLKVCQLCAVDFTLEKFLLPLVSKMLAQDWDVHSVCSAGPALDRIRAQGYKTHVIEIERGLFRTRHLSALIGLIRLFRRERFDVLHTHTPIAALIGRFAAKITGIPTVIYTAHGFYFHDDMPRWKYFFYVLIEKLGGLFTDLLFTQSSEDAQTAARYNLVNSKHIYAIGNGVDLQYYSPVVWNTNQEVRTMLAIPMDAFVVGFVGRLVPEKGIFDLLQAAENVFRESSRVWFVLVGERLKSDRVKGLGGTLAGLIRQGHKRVCLLGPRDDIPRILSAVDLFCLPSHREGMPRSVIEAMAMGKPVVASNIRGCREEVVHGETGILISPRAPHELSDAILHLSENPEQCRLMGEKGRARTLAYHDESQILSYQIKIIREYLCEHQAT